MIAALFIALAGQALAAPPTTMLAPPVPLAAPAPLRLGAPPGSTPALSALRTRLEAIAAVPSGDVGIAVLDPRTGQSVAVNGGRRFPMASTVKVAIAAFYLAEVDLGRRSLSDMIAVDDRLRLRADGITFFAPHPGVVLSGANLIELMLTRSDNTATDVLLRALGGPARVEDWLERNRLAGMRIDRTIAELLLDRRGARPAAGRTAAETLRRWDPVAPGSVGEADNDNDPKVAGIDQDPRDTATPIGFAQFLDRLHSTALLRPGSRDFLLGVMRRCLTGANRLKGLLPAGTTVEHKTGTLAGITDDVGFIALPDGRRLIVTVFVRGGADRPALIARAARAAYDAFTAPLMLLHIVARGKIGRSSEAELVDRYVKRIGWPTKLTELPDRGGSVPPLPANGVSVVLDERGEALASTGLAAKLESWRDGGKREVRFLVGGADGHGEAGRAVADLLLSFGPATWPHLLVRAMLAEQLFRATSILAHHPYHREG